MRFLYFPEKKLMCDTEMSFKHLFFQGRKKDERLHANIRTAQQATFKKTEI